MRTSSRSSEGANKFRPVRVGFVDRGRAACELDLADAPLPLPPWPRERAVEIEIGFGKGRYLLSRAQAERERGFVGIESAPEYYTLALDRARRRGLQNVLLVCGEAVYVAATCLAKSCAEAVHVYFPDPWPKARHQRRRLFAPANLDLVLGLLKPGGRLYFATDHEEYGAAALDLLRNQPALRVEVLDRPWADGARTNYEIKYEEEGRPILRLVATRVREVGPLEPPIVAL